MPFTEDEKKELRETVDFLTEIRDLMLEKGWKQNEVAQILSAMLAKTQ